MTLTRANTPIAATILILPAAALLAYQVAQEYQFGSRVEPQVLDEKVASLEKKIDKDDRGSIDILSRDMLENEVAGHDNSAVVRLDDGNAVIGQRRERSQSEGDVVGGVSSQLAAVPHAEPAPGERFASTKPKAEEARANKSSSRQGGSATFGSAADAPAATVSANRPPPAVRKTVRDFTDRSNQATQSDQVFRSKEVRPAPGVVQPAPEQSRTSPVPESGTDSFKNYDDNSVKSVKAEPVSTFSIDVDTASYAFVRRALHGGALPPADAVRVEEMVNYFNYNYPAPDDATTPFATHVALYPTPWNTDTKLLHVGIQAYDLDAADRPAANLVFLIDVSGSMNQRDKLPLLKSAFRMLLNQLGPTDTVSIVTYAGHAGTVLEPTAASESSKILRAIDQLQPGGSTAGAAGIEEAYRLAESARIEGGTNRVILATDGDFNVGLSSPDALKSYIEDKRRSGIFLSVLGFGQGNYKDDLMQTLAQNGNGVAAYIDTLNEARKVLVDEAGAALFTVAKDVKIQVEFNPATVSEYRLIGYETRALNREDFNNDRVDAGDIGAGHSITAIYELTPTGSPAQLIDDLRYSAPNRDDGTEDRSEPQATGASDEYAFLKLRYKLPAESRSTRIDIPVTTALETETLAEQGNDVRFAASVAAFGQKLRHNRAVDQYGYGQIAALASGARGTDQFGYRSELVSLVRLAESLDRR